MPVDADTKRRLLSDSIWSHLSQRLRLSPKEAEVVRGLLNKRSETGIAKEMGVSRHTVHTHIKRLYRKLRITSRSAAIAHVFEEYLRLERSLGIELSQAEVRIENPEPEDPG